MPNLIERHMTLGRQSFEQEDYETARVHFEEVYEREDDVLVNLYLTKTLVALKEYQQAYKLLMEKKNYYEQHKDYQETYFQVLLSLTYFFEIDKLFSLMGNKVPDDWSKSYQISKEYTFLMDKKRLSEIEEELLLLGSYQFVQQGTILKNIKYLPKEKAIPIIKQLLVDKHVAIFTRTELIQELIRIKYNEEILLVTWEGKEASCLPIEVPLLKVVYQTNLVLKEVSDYLIMNHPSLFLEVAKTIRLHLGCVYPFQDEVMKPVDKWVTSYLMKYETLSNREDLNEILSIQEKLDEEVFKLMSFH